MSDQDGRASRTARLTALIKPLRSATYEVDCQWQHLAGLLERLGKDYGGLDLCPDFQRGHVWTQDQQRHFVENVLRGIVSTSGLLVQFNCANWKLDYDETKSDLPLGLQCIDGVQRMTAVSEFLAGRVHPFGLGLDDLENSSFSPINLSYRFRIAVHDYAWRADLLQHYLDLNAGGTPHPASEIERVRALLKDCQRDGPTEGDAGRLTLSREVASSTPSLS